jgi:hypothetical protein
LLARQRRDWGDIPPEDAAENRLSLREGYRVLSSYAIGDSRVWVITEADRSVTTLLLPDDYWQAVLPNDEFLVTVEVRVVVHVAPTDDALSACRSQSQPARFIHDVVRDEIEPNLASASYV